MSDDRRPPDRRKAADGESVAPQFSAPLVVPPPTSEPHFEPPERVEFRTGRPSVLAAFEALMQPQEPARPLPSNPSIHLSPPGRPPSYNPPISPSDRPPLWPPNPEPYLAPPPGAGSPQPGGWAPPQPAQGQPVWTPAPPSTPSARTRTRWPIWLTIIVLLVVFALVGTITAAFTRSRSGTGPAPLNNPAPGGPVSLTTPVQADRGEVVFHDSFQDSGAGWLVGSGSLDERASYAFGVGGYQMTGSGNLYHDSLSPFTEPVDQLGVSVTATGPNAAPIGSGFGVACRRGSGTAVVRYEFFLKTSSVWDIVRSNGMTSDPALRLKAGTAPASPGATPATVVGMCSTQPDDQTTRLTMFVDGTQVADITDAAPKFSDSGWRGGVSTSSVSTGPTMVTASEFVERNLQR